MIPGIRKYDLSPLHPDISLRSLLPKRILMNQTELELTKPPSFICVAKNEILSSPGLGKLASNGVAAGLSERYPEGQL